VVGGKMNHLMQNWCGTIL